MDRHNLNDNVLYTHTRQINAFTCVGTYCTSGTAQAGNMLPLQRYNSAYRWNMEALQVNCIVHMGAFLNTPLLNDYFFYCRH